MSDEGVGSVEWEAVNGNKEQDQRYQIVVLRAWCLPGLDTNRETPGMNSLNDGYK